MSHLATINLLSRWTYYELENTLPSTLQRILKLCAKNTGQKPNIHNSLYYYAPGYRIINNFLIEWELKKFSGSSFFFFPINQSCLWDQQGLQLSTNFTNSFWKNPLLSEVGFSIEFQSAWFYPVFGLNHLLYHLLGQRLYRII